MKSILYALTFMALPLQAAFSNGSLDTTFNPVGTFPGVPGVETIISLTKYFGAGTSAATVAGNDIALQTDGKLVAIGLANPTAAGGTTFAVVRINGADGSLDTTFNPVGTFPGAPGVESLTLVQTFSTGTTFAEGESIAIQANGQIILFGNARNATIGAPILTAAFIRLRSSNGTVDATWNPVGAFPGNPGAEMFPPAAVFGAGATLFIANGPGQLAVQSNGQIIFVGESNPTAAGGISFTIGRLNASNGSLDTSWNPNPPATFPGIPGVETLPLTTFGGATSAQAQSVAIQTDGQIVVGGFVTIGVNQSGAIVRLNASNGTLDTSWNPGSTPGVLLISPATIGSNSIAINSIAVQSDGKIVAAGIDAGGDPFIARYNTNGTLDTSFNSGGAHPGFQVLPTAAFGPAFGNASNIFVRIQSDGAIVAAGNDATDGFTYYFRLLSNGSLDTSFNPSGAITGTPGTLVLPKSDFGSSADTTNAATSVLIQPNGNIVSVGFADPNLGSGTEQSFSFVRLAGASSAVNCLATAIIGKYCPAP